MNLHKHLPTDIEKIQSGVSRSNARQIARQFLESQTESPSLDAELILAFACGISRMEFVLSTDQTLTNEQASRACDLLTRRALGEPVAYLLGTKEFYGLDFVVNADVLIPRPDTELLVEAALDSLRGVICPQVIDVCTGSGCVAIAIAHQATDASVVAVDISPQAVSVARENATRLHVSDRVQVRLGDLLTPCLSETVQVDVIVANPPYIPAKEMAGLMRDVRDFEPHLALLGEDEDGLGLHCKLAQQSLSILKPGGVLLMEIGLGQAQLLSNRVFLGFARVEFLQDYSGIQRVAKFVKVGSNHG